MDDAAPPSPSPLRLAGKGSSPASPTGDSGPQAGPSSSSLDPQQTSDNPSPFAHVSEDSPPSASTLAAEDAPTGRHWLPEWDPACSFLHSGWQRTRRAIRDALVQTNQREGRIARFEHCGDGAWVFQNVADSTDVRVKSDRCGDRLCLPCATARAARLRDALRARLSERPTTFITLTLADTRDGLAASVNRLYDGFRQLRSLKSWKTHVAGGAAFLEIKYSAKAGRWHPHLHIICHARFWEQAALSDCWRAITRDSYIVDIRRVKDTAESTAYVTKYASKPLNSSFAHCPSLLQEAVLALRARRLCLCFGTWYGTPLNGADAEELEDEATVSTYKPICTLADLLQRAAQGQAQANELLGRIRRARAAPTHRALDPAHARAHGP